MAGKVTTLFEDSAKTQAIFPRTKASAVSDADNHPLGDVAVYNAEDVISGAETIGLQIKNIVGIDTSKLLLSTSERTYTAPKDCYAVINGNNTNSTVAIDGVTVCKGYNGEDTMLVPLKKNQQLTISVGSGSNTSSLKIYDIKNDAEGGNFYPISESSISMDLLWSNAAPTGTFADQTLALGLTNYKCVYVIFRANDEDNDLTAALFLKNNIKLEYVQHAVTNGGTQYVWRRYLTVSDNGIVFNGGWRQYGIGSGTAGANSAYGIPYQIYGIK